MRATVFALVLAGTAEQAFAQSDTQMWAEGGVERALTDRLDLGGALHIRMGEDVSRVVALMPEIELTYRVLDWLRIGPGYRLEHELTGSGDFENRHRLFGDVALRTDQGRLRLGYRTRLQHTLRDNGDRTIWRNKLGADWRGARPWVPGAAIELFTDLADGSTAKWRLTIGTEYELSSAQDLEIYYRYEDPGDPADPTLHIIGLGYARDL